MSITVQDFINAIRKNGLPKISGWYYDTVEGGVENYLYETDPDKVIGGCAFGQAAINLGVAADRLDLEVGSLLIYIDGEILNQHIRDLNDHTDASLAEIATELDIKLTEEDKQRIIPVGDTDG